MRIFPEDKVFYVSVDGDINVDEATSFIQELRSNIEGIKTEEFNLALQVGDLKIESLKSGFIMAAAMSIYKKMTFKNIFSIVEDIERKENQNKLIGSNFAEKIIFANSLEEVLEKSEK